MTSGRIETPNIVIQGGEINYVPNTAYFPAIARTHPYVHEHHLVSLPVEPQKFGQSLFFRYVYRLGNHSKMRVPLELPELKIRMWRLRPLHFTTSWSKNQKFKGGEKKKKSQVRHPENLTVDPMSFPNSKHSDVGARNGSLDSADQVSLLKSRKWDTRPCTSPIPESDLPFLDSEKWVSLERA